ncbi:hypothetical protein AH545_003700 [Salmonella enterica subsp. enterica]|uniref:Periplasmic protein n=1 Tax=Salmonella enterica subsp. enterica serovar Saintpaul TaxID=90105 RepID=A0A753GE42_SALET|nr:hypothetical protein [Salmonella enterica subsp. enterica serovar Typhimurium]EAN5798709.1 hypothetical protein [Salmonella enterica]EBY7586503.1 hypothetical protein [Salmonella enterica subsp. enterica serovar Indiana]EBZ0378369.1 hypothetical protein [Salmonella enterica subsp. enterica serovar Newport]ECA4269795.1 hypothetical protein [Salmonella enterica subsp. enterica serovar Java]ECF3499719.1 hypothetical protein [Salmonella enterica subsp. enterica]HAF8075475.1 hypothetical protei
MKAILLSSILLASSTAASAMDYKPVIQSLMNDVCSSSDNVSVCMYQFAAAVKAGKTIGESVQNCKGRSADQRGMLGCDASESSAHFVDALFDTNRKIVESAQ